VFYESVAEGLLVYQGPSAAQTVQEGEEFRAHYAFTNISPKSFADSLTVKTETIATTTGNRETNNFKIKAPAPGDTTKFSLTIHTRGKEGPNDIDVFVNPKIQAEQYYENNVIDLAGYLNVVGDHAAPALDVTVDGRYLQNGDYVSPNPSIRIQLHDSYPFLLITDTTHLNIFLSYPCDHSPCPYQRIRFKSSDVQWSPATATADFITTFNPVNLPAGTYTLQVMGSDASGNMSGPAPYEVTFQVKNETTMALRAVYPNPSRESFNFSFILSGNVLPNDFSLQIYSSNGMLLQQFGMDDVDSFIIGTNNLNWSPSSEYLLNGLFIYRLTIYTNGKAITQSGKLILVR
jgi:hypothetical protein